MGTAGQRRLRRLGEARRGIVCYNRGGGLVLVIKLTMQLKIMIF